MTLLAATAAVFTACGGDDPFAVGETTGDPLTQEEMQLVAEALYDAFSDASSGGGAAPVSGPAAAPQAINESVTDRAACEGGGFIDSSGRVRGTVDDETFALDLDILLTFEPDGCVIPTATTTITVESAPGIQWDFDMVLNDDLFSISGTQRGGFSYAIADGRTGSCGIDLFMSVAVTQTTTDISASGTICGVSASTVDLVGTT